MESRKPPPPGESLAKDWFELSELATAEKWEELATELSARLDEEELKLNRMGIQVNFAWLGWKILAFAAMRMPGLPWEDRVKELKRRGHELLGSRHMLLN